MFLCDIAEFAQKKPLTEKQQNRRKLIKNVAKGAALVGGGIAIGRYGGAFKDGFQTAKSIKEPFNRAVRMGYVNAKYHLNKDLPKSLSNKIPFVKLS